MAGKLWLIVGGALMWSPGNWGYLDPFVSIGCVCLILVFVSKQTVPYYRFLHKLFQPVWWLILPKDVSQSTSSGTTNSCTRQLVRSSIRIVSFALWYYFSSSTNTSQIVSRGIPPGVTACTCLMFPFVFVSQQSPCFHFVIPCFNLFSSLFVK